MRRSRAAQNAISRASEKFPGRLCEASAGKTVLCGEYKGDVENTTFGCVDCGTVWETTPDAQVAYNVLCKTCHPRNGKFTTQQNFEAQLSVASDGKIWLLEVYQRSDIPTLVQCTGCFHVWRARPSNLLGNKTGCPECAGSRSRSELVIEQLLTENEIEHSPQHCFDDCRGTGGRVLPFDFAIYKGSKLSHLVEYDGRQHFEPVLHFGGLANYLATLKSDKLKNEYCSAKNIKLIRIPFGALLTLDVILGKASPSILRTPMSPRKAAKLYSGRVT